MSREIGFGSFLLLVIFSLFATVVLVGILYLLLSPIFNTYLSRINPEHRPGFWIAFGAIIWFIVLYMVYAAFWRGTRLR